MTKEYFIECVEEIKRVSKNLDKLDECFPGGDIWASSFADPIYRNINLLAYCLAGDDDGYTEENLANAIWETRDTIDWGKFYDNYNTCES